MSNIHDDLTTVSPVADPLVVRRQQEQFQERIARKFGTPTELQAMPPIADLATQIMPDIPRYREHEHRFTYQLNNNHTALRGCSCGLTFVTLAAGNPADLVWHVIRENDED